MRTYTREQVEQVVENYRNALISDPHVRESDCRLMMSAADEVLRRLDALPNSERRLAVTLGESCAGDAGDGKCTLAYPHAGECALPNPPAVPESSPTRSIAQGIADMTRHLPILPGVVPWDGKLEPRPRAPTPVPEVPALKDESHYRCADPDCEAPERPEPTAPEVVWTGDGIEVDRHGIARLETRDGRWPQVEDNRVQQLARALAEAKREAWNLNLDHSEALLNNAEGARKASESMRERAAAESERLGRQWGILRSMKMTEHANAAMEVAAAIRALSLEEP